jgi:hypothetical protein
MGATEVSLPLIMRNNSGFNTWFNVQNAGSEDAVVSVSFAAGLSGSDYTAPDVTIAPGAAYTFDQSTMTDLGDTFVGSATVMSTNDVPVVATAVEVGPDTLYAYDGFITSDTDFVAPLFQYYNAGFSSSIQVQNTGDTATDVTIAYTPSFAGTACEETQTIQPGSAATFGLFAFAQAGNDCNTQNPGSAFVGSARVSNNSADQNLVAIVNQHNFGTGKAAAYSAFTPGQATQCASLPLIMDRNSNYWTGFSIINVGADTTVTVDYSDFGTTSDDSIALTSGQSDIRLQNNAIEDGYVGSANICGADAGDQILVIVNEQNLISAGDQLFTYNAFNY